MRKYISSFGLLDISILIHLSKNILLNYQPYQVCNTDAFHLEIWSGHDPRLDIVWSFSELCVIRGISSINLGLFNFLLLIRLTLLFQTSYFYKYELFSKHQHLLVIVDKSVELPRKKCILFVIYIRYNTLVMKILIFITFFLCLEDSLHSSSLKLCFCILQHMITN